MGLSLLSCGAGLVALSLGGPAEARTYVTFARTQSGQQATVPAAHVFGSDAGMVLNFIKPDKTADFEAVIGIEGSPEETLRNDTVPYCVKHQFSGVVQIEFLQNVGSMRFDGRRTHAQHFRDFLVAVTFSNELKDLAFAL